ncbi:MAG: hypothetical protein JJU05_07515 [Verrucomicrobia bacterium]|nr:hypothetical protein [Verrucomicrobiota bacterium]MCH8527774.1 hypothetical protein [Kiritimatiellia bacterium]
MKEPISHTQYRRYLRDPLRFRDSLEIEHIPVNAESDGIDVPLTSENNWSDLFNHLNGFEKKPYRKVGGFVREKMSFMDESDLVNTFKLPPFPGPGNTVRLNWNHLTAAHVGGTAWIGNFAGPGASVAFFARPACLFDLIAKIHDFAYEINGLTFDGRSRPEAVWSRLAKADWIFQKMLDSTGSTGLHMWLADRFSECLFRADPALFRSGDGFINPIKAMPKHWLMIAPQYLAEEPSIRVRITRNRGGRRRRVVRKCLDPYLVTDHDKADFWKYSVQNDIPTETIQTLERLGSDYPDQNTSDGQKLLTIMPEVTQWHPLSRDGWTKEISIGNMPVNPFE